MRFLILIFFSISFCGTIFLEYADWSKYNTPSYESEGSYINIEYEIIEKGLFFKKTLALKVLFGSSVISFFGRLKPNSGIG